MKQHDEIILTITDISEDGKSLGRHDGCVVFVKGGVPNDVVKARIIFAKKKFAEAEILELITPSPFRVDARCSYFGTCGGCAWQNLNYEQQLFFKQKRVEDAFKHIGGFSDLKFSPIIKSENGYYYRNKMEFSFAKEQWLNAEEFEKEELSQTSSHQPQTFLGLHVANNWKKVLDIKECFLQSETSNRIVNFVRKFAQENSHPAYSPETQTGFFRNLVIREGKNTNEIMVNIVSFEDNPTIMEKLSRELVKQIPQVTTIVNAVNTQIAQVARGESEKVYFGKGFITDTIGKFRFKISANSFFQTNTQQAGKLYSVAKQLAALEPNDIVYDLYCGTGTIALYLSDSCSQIFGIDVVESAIIDARENAELNKVENAFFISRDLQQKNISWRSELPLPNVIIVDPPRNGLHSKVVEEIVSIAPKKIIYVSCNPATQARDCKMLSSVGYTIVKLQPVDMFPQSTHVENVCLLSR
ncbi:MAG: 23S rRNA (uracil(1939)-C(5))-methyltransferase RlmD [Ignavibacteriales bacterium]|nr:23S rRNA (uracil(1939)-C(5))-methyltransferase RlmD [Ignavibacteriales bacterium]